MMGKFTEYLTHDLWRVMRPLAYHGEGKSAPFFEGWYFKIISFDGEHRMSIIPGNFIGRETRDCHAFIQVNNGVDGSSRYIPFSADDFRFLPGEMDISILGNHFTEKEISLDLHSADFNLVGKLSFNGLYPWPVTPLSPGVMGWYAWVPGMECYHGIVSMDHHISGELTINGKRLDFTGGRGYMEKDWGMAMPRSWIWMQSNHFNLEGVSLTVSIADIPWGRRSFTGFLGGFLLNGQLHRFTTYTGAKVRHLSVSESSVQFVLQDRVKQLDLTAYRAQGFNLQAPTTAQMDRRIMETLSAVIDVAFKRKNNRKWEEIFSGTGRFAGLEVVGDSASLF
jgi:tocopherol cyclase